MNRFYERHREGMKKVVQWFKDEGIEISWTTRILETTILDIHIRHDNDYVELGWVDDDPEGLKFHCFTSQVVQMQIPMDMITKIMCKLKDGKIGDGVILETDINNQFTMQRHMYASDYRWKHIEFHLEFRVYHEWK
jgi:hypothetical protein